jgi:outer membrane receptor protein involved in Fe transport
MIVKKTRMFALLSAASGLALIAAGAHAQDAQPADAAANMPVADAPAADASTDDAPVIIVSGQRKALQNAQQIKKNADQIVDSITAVDIGALPDRSVTEALQRIAGVTIGRTNEPRDIDRLNVEGSGVMIRGLTWVRSEINGRDSFGAKNGRALGWEDVTPELAAGVDVYKNPSAEIVEGGLGGTVNLRTWMPFDSRSDKIAFSADATYGSLRKEWTPSASVLLSKRFDTKVGEMGVLIDVAHSELKSRLNAIEVDPYNAHGDVVQASYDGGASFSYNGNCSDADSAGTPCNEIAGTTGTVMVPTGVQYRLEDRDKTRDGVYGAFQWRPNDQTEIYATYFGSKARLINADHFAQTSACCSATNNQSFENRPATGTDFTFDENGNFLTGMIVDNGGGGNTVANSFLLNLGTRYGVDDSQTGDFSTGFKWHGDRWSFSGDFQHIDSQRTNTDFTVYNFMTATGGIGLDLSGDLPVISMGDLTATPNVFSLYAAMDHSEIDKARQNTLKFDAGYDFDSDFFRSVKFGVRATDRYSIQRDSGYNWGAIVAPWAFTGQTATAGQFTENQEIVNFSNFFGGDVASPPSLWMPTMNLAQSPSATADYINKLWFTPNLGANLAAPPEFTYGYYCATCGHGTTPDWGQGAAGANVFNPFPDGSLASYLWIWNPATPNAATPTTGMWQAFNGNYDYAPTSTSGLGTNLQRERTTAAYGMLRFGHDTLFGHGLEWDGNFGVRIVKTETNSSGLGHIASLTNTTGDTSAYSPAALQALLFADGSNVKSEYKNSYTNVLPSLNLRFRPRSDMAIRFAAATSIVRPDFYQLQPSFTMSGTFQQRLATEADNIYNAAEGHNYTQAELDAATTPVMYNTGAAFSFYSGNPNLQPMKATSFDLSYEWYIKPGSMLAFGVFDKEIYDYIQSDLASLEITNNGVTETVVGTVPQNHGHGKITGTEFQFTYFYDFLPGWLSGLGTDFNATVLSTKGTQNTSGNVFDAAQIGSSKLQLPLEQLSRYSYNFTLMYNKYGIDARLAYNWRSRYLMSASASNVQAPAYMEDYGQLDASLLYTLNDHFKIGIQAVNLLDTKNVISIDERDNWYYGTQGNMNQSLIYKHNWTVADQRVSLVLRGSF